MKKKRKLGRKLLSFLLTLALVLGLMPGMGLTVYAGSEVSYQEGSWSNNSVAYETKTAANPTTLASDTTAWADGNWYVVPAGGITISTRITVTGTVNLILTDGNTLTASKGITVAGNNTLNIYAQSEGDTAGSLLIDGVDDYQAGIGGDGKYPSTNYDAGTVTIHGGKITVTGGSSGAGIGGSNTGNGGTVTIYGGTIEAAGKSGGAGIGGGKSYNSTGGNGGAVTIYGGKVKATATGYPSGAGIGGGYQGAGGTVTINGGTIEATGSENGAGIGGGREGNGGTVIINGGTVTATGGSDASSGRGGAGIGSGNGGTGGTVTINGGMVIASGGYNSMGIGGVCGQEIDYEMMMITPTPPQNGSLTVNNGLKVYGGNSADPTTEITSEQLNEIYAENYNKTDVYQYMIVSAPPHTHSFTYTVNGDTITATCGAANCGLTSNPTLTIVAPTMTVYQETGKSEVASLTGLQDFNTATGKSLAVTNIMYVGRDGTEYTESTTAPTNAGKYTATITLSGVKTAEGDDKSVAASVDYSIKYAVTFNTNGGSAVPQQLVEAGESATRPTDPTREGNIFGGWFADADFARRYVFDEVTENTTVYAKWGEHRVTWTVGEYSLQDVFTGNAPAADSNTMVNFAAEINKPEGATFEGWKTETDVSGDVTHTAQFSFPVTLNVNGGTINAGNVESYIYGTGATLPTDVTRAKYDFGGWFDNSGLTGTAVTQIGTTATGSKEFWAKWTEVYAVPATVTANSRTYDGTEKPLVTVTGTATGGEMQYALGTATEATQPYTTTIPTATNAGTYYVWYKVVGDSNHADSTPDCVIVSLAKKTATVKADAKSKIFGKDNPALTATVTGAVGTDSINYTLSRAEGENVGEYTIIVTLGENPNYDVTATNGTFTITKATITGVTATTVTATYDGQAHGITVNGAPEGTTVTFGTSEDAVTQTASPTFVNAADEAYKVYYKVSGANYEDLTGSVTVKINRRPVVVSGINANDKDYDEKTDAALDYTYVNFENIVDTDKGKLTVTATGAFEDETIGKGKTVNITGITLGGDAASNYVLAATGQQATAIADISEMKDETSVPSNFVAKVKDFTGQDKQPAVTGLDLTLATSLCTPAELAAYGTGAKLELSLEISKAGALMTPEVVEQVTNALKNEKNVNLDGAAYYDVSLYKKVGAGPAEKVTDLNGSPITVTFDVPEDMHNHVWENRRTYYVVRIHAGVAQVIAETTDLSVTFSTDKFSVYALCYADKRVVFYDNNNASTTTAQATVVAPKTSGTDETARTLLVFGTAFAVAAIVSRIYVFGRRKEEEE